MAKNTNSNFSFVMREVFGSSTAEADALYDDIMSELSRLGVDYQSPNTVPEDLHKQLSRNALCRIGIAFCNLVEIVAGGVMLGMVVFALAEPIVIILAGICIGIAARSLYLNYQELKAHAAEKVDHIEAIFKGVIAKNPLTELENLFAPTTD